MVNRRRGGVEPGRRVTARFHVIVFVLIVAAVAVLNLTTALTREVMFAGIAVAAIPALAIGIHLNRVAHRLSWQLGIVAMSCLSVGNIWQVYLVFLILRRTAGEAECHGLARRTEADCEAPIPVDGAEVRVGVTVGYAGSDGGDEASADALIAAADQAMYERKRAKRRAVVA